MLENVLCLPHYHRLWSLFLLLLITSRSLINNFIQALYKVQSLVPNWIIKMTEYFSILMFVNRFAFWCVFMVHNSVVVITKLCSYNPVMHNKSKVSITLTLGLHLFCFLWLADDRGFYCNCWAFVSGPAIHPTLIISNHSFQEVGIITDTLYTTYTVSRQRFFCSCDSTKAAPMTIWAQNLQSLCTCWNHLL